MPSDQKILCRILAAAFILQLISIGYYLYYIHFFGYLPAPFVADKSDTFMDLYNTLWWSAHDGRYTEWRSIYPPLNFTVLDIMRAVLVPSGAGSDAAHLRATNLWPAYLITALHVAAPLFIVSRSSWRDLSAANRTLIALIAILSPVFLFSMERGNLIILPLFLLPFVFSDRDGWWKPLLLAVAINLKPYLAPLIFAYALTGNWRRVLQSLAFAGGIFLLTGLVEDPDFLLFLQNIRGFADSAVLPARQLLAMPASPSALSRAILLFLNDPDHLSSHTAVLGLMPPLIETIKTAAIILALCGLFLRRRTARIPEAFFVLLVVIVTAGTWAGGYSQIFYLAAIPTLLAMRFGRAHLLVVGALFLPWDLVTLYSEPSAYSQSFITQSTVTATWQIGLGAITRPALNTLLLLLLGLELLLRKTAPGEKERPAEHLRALIPDWRYLIASGIIGLVLGSGLYHFALSTQTVIAAIQTDAGPARSDADAFLTLLLKRKTIPQLVSQRLQTAETAREIAEKVGDPELASLHDGAGRVSARLTSDARFLEIRVSLPDGAESMKAAAAAVAIALRLNAEALSTQSARSENWLAAHWRQIYAARLVSIVDSGRLANLRGASLAVSNPGGNQSREISPPTLAEPIIHDWRLAALIGAIGCGALGYGAGLSRPKGRSPNS